MIKTLVAAAAISLSSTAIAQDVGSSDQSAPNWQFGVYYESLSFDSMASAYQWVGDGANVFGFNLEYDLNVSYLVVNTGMGFVMYDDFAEFSQTVVGDGWLNSGDITSESSDATALNLFAEIGPNYRVGDNGSIALTARLGYGGLVLSERSIANCEDCYSEDIDLSGGAYGVIGASVDVGETSTIGAQYRSYFGGDIESGARLFWQFSY